MEFKKKNLIDNQKSFATKKSEHHKKKSRHKKHGKHKKRRSKKGKSFDSFSPSTTPTVETSQTAGTKYGKNSSDEQLCEQLGIDIDEVKRLIYDCLLKGGGLSMKKELEAFFDIVYREEIIILDGIVNNNIKKKIRHLLKALKLKELELDSADDLLHPKVIQKGYQKFYKTRKNFLLDILNSVYDIYIKNEDVQLNNNVDNNNNIERKENDIENFNNNGNIFNYRDGGKEIICPDKYDQKGEIIHSQNDFSETSGNDKEMDRYQQSRDSWMLEAPSSLANLFGSEKEKSLNRWITNSPFDG